MTLLSRLAFLASLCVSANAYASPFMLVYTGTVTSASNVGGLAAVGDAVTVQVIVDNGGSSTLSQTWAVSNTVSAIFSAGSYQANFTADWFPIGSGFTTDALGGLILAGWYGTEQATGSDNFGSTGADLSNVGVDSSNGGQIFAQPLFGLSAWSNPVAVIGNVPEPSALAIVPLGLVGLALTTRRRRQPA